jgi:hypothetical protein
MACKNGILEWLVAGEMARFAQQILRRREHTEKEPGRKRRKA